MHTIPEKHIFTSQVIPFDSDKEEGSDKALLTISIVILESFIPFPNDYIEINSLKLVQKL